MNLKHRRAFWFAAIYFFSIVAFGTVTFALRILLRLL